MSLRMRYRTPRLCLSQAQQRDLGRRAETYGDADGADAARNIFGGRAAPVQSIYVWRKKTRRVDGLMQDFHVHLAAVRVSGQRQIVSFFHGYRKDVGIVG